MLNAYRNIENDIVPAAPEFWFFYPARVLGITVDEFQREVPHWQGLLETFKKFGCEGWGTAGAAENNPHVVVETQYTQISDEQYRDSHTVHCGGKTFDHSYLFSKTTPFWSEQYAVKDPADARLFFEAHINDDIEFDFSEAIHAHKAVGDVFLLEFDLGLSFFDFFEQFMGFEGAALYFMDEDEGLMKEMAQRYTEYKVRQTEEAIKNTPYEAYFIGCSSSCNALLGPELWRKWDKPYEKAITEVVHSRGLLIHNHNHGKIMETVPDLVDIGFDCVCPFERPPGDVAGLEGLKKVRELLQERVSFNGNVHTVQALAYGTPEDVRVQVREIKEAFKGSNRLIVGTGDQVAGETPEENLWAMIDEAHKFSEP